MKVKLIIYSNLKNYVKNYDNKEGIVLEIPSSKKIIDFLKENIEHDKAVDAISMVIVNNKAIPFNQLDSNLKDGDIVKVYPPMGGG